MFTAMAVNFMAFVGPANPMVYDAAQFYNTATAIVLGIGAGALSFRLLPPLSPTFRTHRLLMLTLRDLRRLLLRRSYNDWEGHVHGRLSAMPKEATPLQRAQLLAALSVGTEVIQLCYITALLGVSARLDPAFSALAQGNTAAATAHLTQLDAALAGQGGAGSGMQIMLRARASILALSEALTKHAVYFEAGADE
jgi:uncharacterized membrane protein YccC